MGSLPRCDAGKERLDNAKGCSDVCRKGILVWQDAVSMFWENDINYPTLQERSEVAKQLFEHEMHRMIEVCPSSICRRAK